MINQFTVSLSLISLISNFVLPQYIIIEDTTNSIEVVAIENGLSTLAYGNVLAQTANPITPKVAEYRWVLVTAYSSTEDQTDSTPFITASGSRVREGIVACNFLRFGDMVRFPELSESMIYVVEDRMALKNSHKIDIWFPTREEAKQFGVKVLKVEILDA